jgi:hypothetical protein
MKKSVYFYLLAGLFALASCGDGAEKKAENSGENENSKSAESSNTAPAEGSYTWRYKLGNGDANEVSAKRSLRVYMKYVTTEDESGKEYIDTQLGFTLNDFEKKLSFKFTVLAKGKIESFKGNYPLVFPTGYSAGEAQNGTSLMIVNTEGGPVRESANAPGNTCQVECDGKKLRVTVKGAKVSANMDDTESLEFSLEADNIEFSKE